MSVKKRLVHVKSTSFLGQQPHVENSNFNNYKQGPIPKKPINKKNLSSNKKDTSKSES